MKRSTGKKDDGVEALDYDFWGKKMSVPKKTRSLDASREMNKLLRETAWLLNSPPKKKRKKDERLKARRAGDRKQPCVAKMYYGDDKSLHKNFLRKYMPQKDKDEVPEEEKPRLFNGEYDVVPDSELERYESGMAGRHFKWILSPESQDVPMKVLARSFIRRLEVATGFRLSWLAAIHTDTGHIHAHILINGIDRRTGREIKFPKEVVRNLARTFAMDDCTKLVGRRTEAQVQAAKSRLPLAKYWTRLDEEIKNSARAIPPEQAGCGEEWESLVTAQTDEMRRRLETLLEMGLAARVGKNRPSVYRLERNWEKTLRAVGRFNTFLQARKDLRYVSKGVLERFSADAFPDKKSARAQGIVTLRYVMDDEGVWNNAIVVENKAENRAWYVPLWKKPDESIIGRAVTLSLEPSKTGRERTLVTLM